MTIEYVSWKVGDPLIKKAPQVIQPGVWTILHFDKLDAIVPKHNGEAQWAYYLNVTNSKGLGAAKTMDLRFTRNPMKNPDFTGQRPLDLSTSHIFSGTWFFKAKVGQPVSLEVRNNGKKPIIVTTREFKMWIP
jgi:hypothetical protein